MASNSGILPSFEKLQGESNYATWKLQMELYLIHEGLWKYTQTTPDNDDLEKTQDQLARAKIGLMVEKSCLTYIKQSNNARESWEALGKAFDDAGTNNKGRLLSKLVCLKLDQFGSMRQYVTAVISAAKRLEDIGEQVDDELLATILLQGLSEEYAPIRLTIEHSNNVLTTDYVKTELLGFEDRNLNSDENDFCIRNKPRSCQRKGARNKRAKCQICRGNHATRECSELSMTVSSKYVRERDITLNKPTLSRPQSTGRSPAEWIMDSGDYAYMTNRRDYPCFLLFARLLVNCLAGIFKLW